MKRPVLQNARFQSSLRLFEFPLNLRAPYFLSFKAFTAFTAFTALTALMALIETCWAIGALGSVVFFAVWSVPINDFFWMDMAEDPLI